MYQYYHNPNYDLLVIRHFNDFIGAESTKSLIKVTQFLPQKHIKRLKHIIIDFRQVSSATLYDTDRALHSLLHAQLAHLPSNLKLVRLYDKANPATEILAERVTRTLEQITKDILSPIEHFSVYSERDVLALLDIPKEMLIWADGQWLPPPDS